ncbi:UDP-glucuronosyltransferase 1-1-like isoform X1 [Myripristis murdjan]|uniref:UDP-glucuronosyltransferase 1-1-like isoform X1 n=1 Tax=Myripristis murdjan TaxID=586833 RepID=UPI001175E1A9|nr:UDP-glucuronosyltransferase 1-1-like isoform X1 [Myripristis murdjan]
MTLKKKMWKAVVCVCLLVNVAEELNAAGDEARRPAAENTGPKTKARGSLPESPSGSFFGRLLVIPMDGSHWVGVKAVAEEMGRRGHQVTVVIPEVSVRMGPGKHYKTLTFPVPYGKERIDSVLDMYTKAVPKSTQSFLEKMNNKVLRIWELRNFIHTTTESLLFNTSLISHLSQQRFDAVLMDPLIPTGGLVARKLGLPTINLLRWIPFSMDMKSAACPAPLSYVPRFYTRFTDKMNFRQRVLNTLMSLLEPLLRHLLYSPFDQTASKFLGEDVTIADVLSDTAIWLMRTDSILDFPRPLMPNMVFVGGINCNIRNPLPQDLESWVSGEHGFVVFTLGSMLRSLPEERAAVFLEAFRQIPQTVIWRHTGPVPDNIPENVKMMQWVPQNELLAHHGVRAFITHAGSHGLYEGLCHAVPMVMMPLNGDQSVNAQRMASRGVGVVLDISTITVETLLQGLNDVINNSRYKESVEKLSALHKDRPFDPLELSVYWTEFVMRHKGATHLRAAAHDLNWVQYHCLDVLALLATVVLAVVMVTTRCMKLCLRRLSRKRKQD